jgi:hypothetical protein
MPNREQRLRVRKELIQARRAFEPKSEEGDSGTTIYILDFGSIVPDGSQCVAYLLHSGTFSCVRRAIAANRLNGTFTSAARFNEKSLGTGYLAHIVWSGANETARNVPARLGMVGDYASNYNPNEELTKLCVTSLEGIAYIDTRPKSEQMAHTLATPPPTNA